MSKDSLAKIRRNLEIALRELERLEDPQGFCEKVVASYCETRKIEVQHLKCERLKKEVVQKRLILTFVLLESFDKPVVFEVFNFTFSSFCKAKKRYEQIQKELKARGRLHEIVNERKFIQSLIEDV